MAQHFWLGQRAIGLQNEAFIAGQSVNRLSLLMRYQTSNQRAYSRCLADLFKLRTERRNGFERQKKIDAENRRRSPKEPYYIRNPKYAHLLPADVPKEERIIKVDPNLPKVRTGEPVIPEIGFESKTSQSLSKPAESQVDPKVEKMIRQIREVRLGLDREDPDAA